MPELDDEDCLADAAAVLAARQRVDPLLLRLAAQPFDVAAIDDLRRWIDEVYPLAAPAWVRLLGLPDPQPTDAAAWDPATVLRLVASTPCAGRRHDDPPWPGPGPLLDTANVDTRNVNPANMNPASVDTATVGTTPQDAT